MTGKRFYVVRSRWRAYPAPEPLRNSRFLDLPRIIAFKGNTQQFNIEMGQFAPPRALCSRPKAEAPTRPVVYTWRSTRLPARSPRAAAGSSDPPEAGEDSPPPPEPASSRQSTICPDCFTRLLSQQDERMLSFCLEYLGVCTPMGGRERD